MFDNDESIFSRTVLKGTESIENAMYKVFCVAYEASNDDNEEPLPDVTAILSTREKDQMIKTLISKGTAPDAAEALVEGTVQLATMANIASGIFAPHEFGLGQGAFLQGSEPLPGLAYSLEFGEGESGWVTAEATATVLSNSGVFDDDMLLNICEALEVTGTGIRPTGNGVTQESLDLAQELLDMMKTKYSRNLYDRSIVEGSPFMGTEMLSIIGKCLVRFTVRFIFDPKDVTIVTDIPNFAIPHGTH